jgi:ABC-2 type transport system ATP-binding protein
VSEIILHASGLAKTFRKPFSGKKVEAVRGVSFDVGRGEIFGFLGPNGSGKTTTIKMLTGLISATRGSATLFGHTIPSPEAMERVGFLPENPYIYPYLTPREFVSLCGRLSGLSGAKLARRVEVVIESAGVSHAIDRAVRTLSKGMTQRVGLAAAMVHEPELLLLDEPMSGLDPVGRKEVRDLIVEEKRRGRTVFFSSHILSDVEMLCDRVCILRSGEVALSGMIRDLLGGVRRIEVALRDAGAELEAELDGERANRIGDLLVVEVADDAAVRAVVERAWRAGARVESITPKRETLEDVFVRKKLSSLRPTA